MYLAVSQYYELKKYLQQLGKINDIRIANTYQEVETKEVGATASAF